MACPSPGQGIATLPQTPNSELPVTIQIEALHTPVAATVPLWIVVRRDPQSLATAVSTAKPLEDESFTLRCKVRWLRPEYQGADLDADFEFKLAANETQTQRWCYLPSLADEQHQIAFQVFKNGYEVLGFERAAAPTGIRPAIGILLAPGEKNPALPMLYTDFSQATFGNDGRSGSRSRFDRWDFYPLTTEQYFDRWQGYLSFQAVLIPAKQFESLPQENPQAWDALMKWVIAGGCLDVFGENASELVTKRFGTMGAVDPNRLKFGSFSPNTFSNRMQTSLRQTAPDFLTEVPDNEVIAEFQESRYGGGYIIAYQGEELPALTYKHWNLLVPSQRTDDNHRFSLHNPGQMLRFSTAINQKLSGTPIYWFWGLITLFVALIGPALFILLYRTRKMYRVYLWVPPFALTIAVITLIVVTVMEGKQTREAASKLTFVDSGQSEVSVTSETIISPLREGARLSSHSVDQYIVPTGIVPAVYDQRPYVRYGIRPEDRENSLDRPAKVKLTETARGVEWTGNLFGTREQRCYVSVEPKTTNAALELSTDAIPKLTNRLKVDLADVVVRDRAGNYWQANAIGQGESTRMTPIPPLAAPKILRDYADRLPLVRDEGLMFQADHFAGIPIFTTRGRRGSQVRGIDMGIPVERMLAEWKMGTMPNDTFLGSTQSSPERLLLQDGLLIDTVHVVMGTLK